MKLASKSKDNSSITLENGRQFIVMLDDIEIVKNWSIGTELEIKTSDSRVPYNHIISNPSREEKIRVGIPK
ncbi:hypothetical protein [Aestuariibaculum suncheonense]|uniref:Uncharacterized protein n=1 Tax=Aestuariibaculum suncheonense TaxID=1028745 RepID=A0A8J6Q5C5_9FLAO|nr:hypothetical protein [Aestuariibaculum suncheonense]MBD0834469.1 hypothetical protein [Aestuariibaculum suncheonense]